MPPVFNKIPSNATVLSDATANILYYLSFLSMIANYFFEFFPSCFQLLWSGNDSSKACNFWSVLTCQMTPVACSRRVIFYECTCIGRAVCSSQIQARIRPSGVVVPKK